MGYKTTRRIITSDWQAESQNGESDFCISEQPTEETILLLYSDNFKEDLLIQVKQSDLLQEIV